MRSEASQAPLRYAVNDSPPQLMSAALGLQVVVLIVAGIVLTPTIVLRAAGDPGNFTTWAVFAGLIVSGVTTVLQARPLGRFGAGHVLFMGTSGAFIAVAIDALDAGGMPLLATLIVASSLVQFAFANRLSALRNIVTPAVGGTTIMLIAVTVSPIAFDMLNKAPAGVPQDSSVGPVSGFATFAVILGVSLFAKGSVRLWAPIVGIIVGSALAVAYGAFDLSQVARAPWIGLPEAHWPGLDLSFKADFWALLIPFIIVTIVGAIETYGDGIAIQRLSRRDQAPIDFRVVQGAVNADGLGNLLSGLAGTLPNTTYSTSLSVVDLTGVAARQIGVYGGIFLVLVGFCPKVATLLISIPNPVAGAYILVLLVLLFLHGLHIVAKDGLGYENGIIVCMSFWLGIGFQNQQIFVDHLPHWSRGLLDNGMTAGAIVAVVLTFLVNIGRPRAERIEVAARNASIPEVTRILAQVGGRVGWDDSAIGRLELAGEEAMLFLIDQPDGETVERDRKVRLAVRAREQGVDLEFICGSAGANLENAAQNIDWDAPPSAGSAGLRILHGLTDRVAHEQFHGVDVLMVRVDSKPL